MRIVSLVPSHTESLFEMGAGDAVVGRTKFCISPAEVAQIPAVGGTKDASLERILALRPDLVVADKDENPLQLVAALQAAGIEVMWSEIDTVPDAGDFLVRLGARIGRAAEGSAFARAIEDALAAVCWSRAPLPVFVPIWYAPWMTFDSTAYPDAMLSAVGFRNVFRAHGGPKYFEVQAAEVAATDAVAALLPTEPFPFHRRMDAIDTADLGACGDKSRLHIIDGEALTWFGTRTPRALRDLAKTRVSLESLLP